MAACSVNGALFRTVEAGKNKKTQNSGVMLKVCMDNSEEETKIYGVLKEVLEFEYVDEKSVFVFRCDWFNLAGRKKGTKMKSDGYYRSVNTSVFWYKDDPYMLASQASTCIYLEDTKDGGPWKVVVPIELRGTYDVLEKNDDDEPRPNKVAYQESGNTTRRIIADVEQGNEVDDASVQVDDVEENVDVHDKDIGPDGEEGEEVPVYVVEELKRKEISVFELSDDEQVDEEILQPQDYDSDVE